MVWGGARGSEVLFKGCPGCLRLSLATAVLHQMPEPSAHGCSSEPWRRGKRGWQPQRVQLRVLPWPPGPQGGQAPGVSLPWGWCHPRSPSCEIALPVAPARTWPCWAGGTPPATVGTELCVYQPEEGLEVPGGVSGARHPPGASLEGFPPAVRAMFHAWLGVSAVPWGCAGKMQLHGKNQWLLKVVACVVLACCLCQANLFFFYLLLLLLLPLIFLFEEPIGG